MATARLQRQVAYEHEVGQHKEAEDGEADHNANEDHDLVQEEGREHLAAPVTFDAQ